MDFWQIHLHFKGKGRLLKFIPIKSMGMRRLIKALSQHADQIIELQRSQQINLRNRYKQLLQTFTLLHNTSITLLNHLLWEWGMGNGALFVSPAPCLLPPGLLV
jgi:hypothetical protein